LQEHVAELREWVAERGRLDAEISALSEKAAMADGYRSA
jgi:hypothetical protein